MPEDPINRRTVIASAITAAGLVLTTTTASADDKHPASKEGTSKEEHGPHKAIALHPAAKALARREVAKTAFTWSPLKSGTCTLANLVLTIDANGRASFTGTVSTTSPNLFGDVFDLEFTLLDVNKQPLHHTGTFHSIRMHDTKPHPYNGEFYFPPYMYNSVVGVRATYSC